MTWNDVVDLDKIYLRNACKSPVCNTANLTLRSSHWVIPKYLPSSLPAIHYCVDFSLIPDPSDGLSFLDPLEERSILGNMLFRSMSV